MSMRSDFQAILKEYGHDIYLQRKIGSGPESYSNVLEKHTVRFTIGIHRALTQAQDEAVEGILNTTDRSYYFMYDVKPFEGDRIYDYVDRAPNDQEVWVIDSTVGMRGEGGQIVHWICGVTRIRPD